MAPKRALKKMENKEFMNMVSKEQRYLANISQKLLAVESSEDGEFMDGFVKEIMFFLKSESETLNFVKKSGYYNLSSSKKILEKMAEGSEEIMKRFDEFEKRLLKYNLPYLDSSLCMDEYSKHLIEFMKIWKEEAENGRLKGEKSLKEWLHLLDHHHHQERKTTFEAMKAVVINLGTKISQNLIEFFMVVAVSANKSKDLMQKLDDFSVMVKLLRVEESSTVIERFLAVVELMKRTMKVTYCECCSSTENSFSDSTEMEITRAILKEILRLEVALCCPDLPMLLTDEVYLSIGDYLKIMFEKRLKVVGFKVEDLKEELCIGVGDEDEDEDLQRLFPFKGTLDEGAKEIWSKLEFWTNSDCT